MSNVVFIQRINTMRVRMPDLRVGAMHLLARRDPGANRAGTHITTSASGGQLVERRHSKLSSLVSVSIRRLHRSMIEVRLGWNYYWARFESI